MRRHWANVILGCATCVVVMGGASVARAQDAAGGTKVGPQRLRFDLIDRNADKRLSAEEFRNAMAAVFDSQDRNLDGVVTRKEVELTGPRAVTVFDAAGGRSTGKVTLPQFLDFTMQVFESVDTDGDGFITIDEAKAAVAKVKAARAGKPA